MNVIQPGQNQHKPSLITLDHHIHHKILRSSWWHRATQCVDSHYSNTCGVMLVDHLLAVYENVDSIFNGSQNKFLQELFGFVELLGLDKTKIHNELKLVALLHDIGKTEDDKTVSVPHPLFGYSTIKRHSVVGVYAAMEILGTEHSLSAEEKSKIFAVIEEHDVSFGLFKEYKSTGNLPSRQRWHELNSKISHQHGAGLIYLLIFKLADIHGHANIEDVTWFYQNANETYFREFGLELPIPHESDIR